MPGRPQWNRCEDHLTSESYEAAVRYRVTLLGHLSPQRRRTTVFTLGRDELAKRAKRC